MTRLSRPFYCLLLLLLKINAAGQFSCGIRQLAFRAGEELSYSVVYNWGPMWLESGYAAFSVGSSSINGRPCYHFKGIGGTYPKYDWFFKVDDVFESHADSASFRPLRFNATIHEGNKHDRHYYLFHPKRNTAYTIINRGKKSAAVDTLKTDGCTLDVLTAIYYARSLDFSGRRVNDTIGMSLLIDGQIFPIYVRYLGKAEFVTAAKVRYRCLKFSPLLVEGSIFKKGEGMTVWVTDDGNRLPLYIETPIIVGTVRVSLSSWKGLKYPEAARIE